MIFSETLDGFGHFELVRLDPARHTDVIHGWVREPRARFWGMTEHPRETVREIYEFVDGLDTHHAYLMLLDSRPVGIFQTYEPEHDPIGEFYDVHPGDFGIHLFLAPADPPIPGFTDAVFTALLHFVFAEPTRTRIVIEPDVHNERALKRWKRLGFTFGDIVTTPDKTAQLAFLNR